MNVLAAAELFADDMMAIARHAGGQAGKYKSPRDNRNQTQYGCESEEVSVSRVPAGLVSWFVPVFPMHARRVMRGSTVAVRAATGGGTNTSDDVWPGQNQQTRKNGEECPGR